MQKIVVIKFISPVHMGERGIGIEEASPYIRSDTLYGALISTISMFYGEDLADEIVKDFIDRDPPFLISSLFPILYDKFMLPMPLSIFKFSNNDTRVLGILRQTEYVSIDFFKGYISGDEINPILEEKKERGESNKTSESCISKRKKEEEKKEYVVKFNIGGKTYSTFKGELGNWDFGVIIEENIIDKLKNYVPFKKYRFPKNRLDRISLASDIFYTGLINFNCKHYLILRVKKEYLNTVITALKILGYMGLGGERTYGYGRFRVEKISDEPKIPSSEGGEHLINLSLYLPSEKEMSFIKDKIEEVFYRLYLRIGSYSGKGLARRDVFVFSEGSSFPLNTFNIIGSYILDRVNRDKSIRIYYPVYVKSLR